MESMDPQKRTRQASNSTGRLSEDAKRPRLAVDSDDLARFADEGGPDMSDIRGCRHPVDIDAIPPPPAAVDPVNSPPRPPERSADSATSTSISIEYTVFDTQFEIDLTDYFIYPLGWSPPKPIETADILLTLGNRRPSLSAISDGAFDVFCRSNDRVTTKEDVMDEVLPAILGTNYPNELIGRQVAFDNLDSLAPGFYPAKPDVYYGAHPNEISLAVREDLESVITPSRENNSPLAPNFFVEVNGINSSTSVVRLQARYEGAIGSRAMHHLQNYGKEECYYDGGAYTFSATYQDGHLQLYAHSCTPPTTATCGRTEYHMKRLRSYSLVSTRNDFVRGVTAFRNLRDLAKRCRSYFIEAANRVLEEAAMAPSPRPLPPSDPATSPGLSEFTRTSRVTLVHEQS